MNLAIDSPIDHIYTYVHLFSGIFSDCIALDHHTAVVALSVRPPISQFGPHTVLFEPS